MNQSFNFRGRLRTILTWVISVVLVGGILDGLIHANVEKLAEEKHWDTFLRDWWPTLTDWFPQAMHANWFWFLIGIVVTLWVVKLFPEPKDSSTDNEKALKKIKYWFDPMTAIEKFSDPDLLKQRDQENEKARKLSAKEQVFRKQLATAMKKMPSRIGPMTVPEPPEVAAIRENIFQTIEECGQAVSKANIASESLLKDIHEKLLRGILVARGFPPIIKSDSNPVMILPTQWNILKIDLRSNPKRAVGKGLEYSGIQIGKKS